MKINSKGLESAAGRSVFGIAKVRGEVKTLLDFDKLASSYRLAELAVHS